MKLEKRSIANWQIIRCVLCPSTPGPLGLGLWQASFLFDIMASCSRNPCCRHGIRPNSFWFLEMKSSEIKQTKICNHSAQLNSVVNSLSQLSVEHMLWVELGSASSPHVENFYEDRVVGFILKQPWRLWGIRDIQPGWMNSNPKVVRLSRGVKLSSFCEINLDLSIHVDVA